MHALAGRDARAVRGVTRTARTTPNPGTDRITYHLILPMRVYWFIVFALGVFAALVMALRCVVWQRLRSSWRGFQARRQRPLARMPAHEIAFAFDHRREALERYRRRGTISEEELIEEIAEALLHPPCADLGDR